MPDQVDWRANEREATSGRAVGRLLRDQREARGLSIADIEKRLRIRRTYIDALEQGRFDLLPGAAYIPAFLRAYAAHVGLDPEKVLTAYHLSGAVPIKRPVALPADFPIVERRAPIGLAVLTVLLVVGAGYGVWRYLPRQQVVLTEKVPPVPDRLLASRPATPDSPNKSTTTESPAAIPPTQVVTQGQGSRITPNTLPPGTWPATHQEQAATPAPPVIITVPAPPPVVMSVPSIGQAQAAQPATSESSRPEVQEAAAPPAAPASAPAASDPSSYVRSPAAVDTPVVLHSNSWVELRAPNGDVLAQTYVRAGEAYVIPAGIAYRVIDAAH